MSDETAFPNHGKAMQDNELDDVGAPEEDVSPSTTIAPELLDATISGVVTATAKVEIAQICRLFGWDTSAGIRTVMGAFADSIDVRNAVLSHLAEKHSQF